MLEPLFTAAEMRAAERRYPGFPDSAPELMERAGRAVSGHALECFPDATSFTVVCGGGSNGGDGRIAGEALREAGRRVSVVDAATAEAGLGEPDVIVDALFGTGFSGAPRPEAARLIERMSAAGCPIVAVDLPSGVDASTGEVAGVAVEATLTVTFHGPKVGLVVAPGRFHAGRVVVPDIGLAPGSTEHRLVNAEILAHVPRRGARDTKYSAGSVLVVGGSTGLTGAPCLTAEAAFRADAGYVTVAVPASTIGVFEQRLLEAVKRPLPEEHGSLSMTAADEILELAGRAGAVALGPGLGRAPGIRQLVRRLLGELELPVVVDADALWELEPSEWSAPRVLTPHAGELARLLGEESSRVSAHRLDAVRRVADRFGCVTLLKGPDTLIAAPGEGVLVCPVDAHGLASAGTGDVLTGILSAFLAKGMEPRLAAAAAATAHGAAAALAPRQVGLVASDVIALLPQALAG